MTNMKNSKSLIYNYLKEICRIYPDSIIEYGFDLNTHSHKINFNNLKKIENTEAFQKATKEIIERFIFDYPYEDIIFLSPESSTNVGKVEFTITGNEVGVYEIIKPASVCIGAINIPVNRRFQFETVVMNSKKKQASKLTYWNVRETNNTRDSFGFCFINQELPKVI